MLRIFSTVLWILLGGLWLALIWCVAGILLCVSVVGIPFGLQCFKLAKLSLMPHGKKIVLNFEKHPVANVIWAIIGGWETALAYLLFGVLNCITIIGISRGIQCFKITKLALFPFGAKIIH